MCVEHATPRPGGFSSAPKVLSKGGSLAGVKPDKVWWSIRTGSAAHRCKREEMSSTREIQ